MKCLFSNFLTHSQLLEVNCSDQGLSVVDSQFEGIDTLEGDGGAIFFYPRHHSQCSLLYSFFLQCRAVGGRGGAVFVYDPQYMSVNGVCISRCSAMTRHAVSCETRSTATSEIKMSTFVQCPEVTVRGSTSLYLRYLQHLSLDNFSKNVLEDGTLIDFREDSSHKNHLLDVTIANNSGDDLVVLAGCYECSYSLDFISCNIVGNTKIQNEAFLFVVKDLSFFADMCVFNGNTHSKLFATNNADAFFTGSFFYDNEFETPRHGSGRTETYAIQHLFEYGCGSYIVPKPTCSPTDDPQSSLIGM